MRTITGKVRPFGQGTKPVVIRLQWPETLEEIEDCVHLPDGGEAEELLRLAGKKAKIRAQDEFRGQERWEDATAPDEEDSDAWAEIQRLADEHSSAFVSDTKRREKSPDESADPREWDRDTAESKLAAMREAHPDLF